MFGARFSEDAVGVSRKKTPCLRAELWGVEVNEFADLASVDAKKSTAPTQ